MDTSPLPLMLVCTFFCAVLFVWFRTSLSSRGMKRPNSVQVWRRRVLAISATILALLMLPANLCFTRWRVERFAVSCIEAVASGGLIDWAPGTPEGAKDWATNHRKDVTTAPSEIRVFSSLMLVHTVEIVTSTGFHICLKIQCNFAEAQCKQWTYPDLQLASIWEGDRIRD